MKGMLLIQMMKIFLIATFTDSEMTGKIKKKEMKIVIMMGTL